MKDVNNLLVNLICFCISVWNNYIKRILQCKDVQLFQKICYEFRLEPNVDFWAFACDIVIWSSFWAFASGRRQRQRLMERLRIKLGISIGISPLKTIHWAQSQIRTYIWNLQTWWILVRNYTMDLQFLIFLSYTGWQRLSTASSSQWGPQFDEPDHFHCRRQWQRRQLDDSIRPCCCCIESRWKN